jgi:hypothetical protein
VFERLDGRWEARLEVREADGRRRRKSFYGRTQSEALAKLRQAQRQLDDGLPIVNPKFTPSTPTRTPSRDREQHFYAFEVVTA